MKRLFILLLLATVFTSCTQDTPKVLLYIRGDGLKSYDLELMLTKEVGVMKEILEQSGFEVAVASVSGEPIVAGSTSLKPDLKLDEVSIADYAGFILPCMADSGSPVPEAVTMVKKAAAAGKPVAAQLGSVLTLANAGLLIGKKYAFLEEEDLNLEIFPDLKGGVYSGTGIVQDGNIITSGVCPYYGREKGLQDGTQELTRTLIKVIKARTK